jgi:uncharacterized protein
MSVGIRRIELRFDWDEKKRQSNLSKHGVDFLTTDGVFADPLILEDHAHSEVERRFIAIGVDSKGRLLTVIFAKPDSETCRIVSARKSTQTETEIYAKQREQRDTEGQ